MADAFTPRVHGRLLQLVSRVLASPASGLLRRALGASVIEDKLAETDFPAAGDPLPLYEPRSYRSGGSDRRQGS